MTWFEILIYNMIFWPVWIYVSTIPYRLIQKHIDHFHNVG